MRGITNSRFAAIPARDASPTSFNRPGANVTGVSILFSEIQAKRLELLRDLIPTARTVGFVFDPETPRADIEPTARRLGLQLHARSAATEEDLDAAFAAFVDRRVDAVLVGTSPRFTAWRMRIVGLAARPFTKSADTSTMEA